MSTRISEVRALLFGSTLAAVAALAACCAHSHTATTTERPQPAILVTPAPATHGPFVLHAIERDHSPTLASMAPLPGAGASASVDPDAEEEEGDPDAVPAFTLAPQNTSTQPGAAGRIPPGAAAIEQIAMGPRPAPRIVVSFDGLGAGFEGPHGSFRGSNPSDNSLAVGPDHMVQIVNSRLAVFSKKGAKYDTTGKVLLGPVNTNTVFKGFGDPGQINGGDAVVRYDQLANRWLIVMPIFRRLPNRVGAPGSTMPVTIPGAAGRGPQGQGPYAMCYAVSTGPDPLGTYYRYEFLRPLFPDYPRPAVWIDGYYNPTSTGDTVIQKQAFVADRAKMLRGEEATEQGVIIDGVNFLNNADIDGQQVPPPGAPNIIMAAGGSQLNKVFEDDGIYFWKYHVDWVDPARTRTEGPYKIAVAPYHYLGDGQLTNAVPQPGSQRGLDAQGDKIMQRLAYRRIGERESIVAVHSVNTAGGGGVRWYEFRLNALGDPTLFQQGTYCPGGNFRWMASPAMDADGNIGIGYSFGGTPNFAGQRFAGRLASDPPGQLTLQEAVLVQGGASQNGTNRWEDYTTTCMDPSDDRTMWYVGDYLKPGATAYSTRIGAFRIQPSGGSH